MSGRLSRLAGNLALAGLAVLLALLAAEGAVRLLPVRAAATEDPITEYDSLLGWHKRPAAVESRHTSEYTVEVRTNSAGLRGPEYASEGGPGTVRILLLGDSFTEGYTVAEEDGVAAVLERDLNRADAEHRYVVINGGTRGYSTDQAYLFFRRDGRRYAPDLTVLLFYVNDVWFNTQDTYWRGFKPVFRQDGDSLVLDNVPVPEPRPDRYAFAMGGGRGLTGVVRRLDGWLGGHSALYPLVRGGLANISWVSGLLVRTGLAAVPNEFRPWYTGPDPALEDAWQVTGTLLAQLRDTVEAAGGRFVVLHVPPRPAVRPSNWASVRRRYAMDAATWDVRHDGRRLEEICRRRALTCLFPADRFRAVEAGGVKLYFDQDAHWNAAGHHLAAEVLAEYVTSTLDRTRADRHSAAGGSDK